MRFILELIITALAIMGAAYLLPGVTVSGFWTALFAGILISLANATIGTVLRIFTLPLNILTLGLVSLVVTVLMVLLVSNILNGFAVSGFWSALFFAIIAAVIQMLLNGILGINKDN